MRWRGIGGLHPLIWVASFVVYALVLALAPGSLLIPAALVLLVLDAWARHGRHWHAVITPLRRLRWFFVSLFVLYGWATPGTPLWALPETAWWMPSREGLVLAMDRIGALMAIMLAAVWLLERLTRDELVQAIHGLARPLAWLGLSPQRFSLRLLLVMETMAEVQTIVVRCLTARRRDASPLAQLGQVTANIFIEVLAGADRAPLEPVRVAAYRAPPLWQWACPAFVLALGGGLGWR